MCNCKKKFKPINNLKDQQVLKMVKESYDNLVVGRDIETLTQLDWMELFSMWNLLYPNSSGQPTQNKVIEDLKSSQQYLRIKKR